MVAEKKIKNTKKHPKKRKKNSNGDLTRDIILVVLASVLTLLPINKMLSWIFVTIGLDVRIVSWLSSFMFYAFKIIGLAIYGFALRKLAGGKIALTLITFLLLINSYLAYVGMENMPSRGIDGIGEAIVRAMLFEGELLLYYIFAIILLVYFIVKLVKKKRGVNRKVVRK